MVPPHHRADAAAALLTGLRWRFARAVGEYAPVISFAGNNDHEKEITPLLIVIRSRSSTYARRRGPWAW